MRVVFMGTPPLAATVLKELSLHHDVIGVFTRPDAVRGRGKKLVASAVKQTALELDLPVHTPTSLADDGVADYIRSIEPDCICVAAYGCLLPKEVLDIPRYGCLNVHTSLLPRWRGAAPIERAILEGDEYTGVCIMRMEEGLDTGPYCIRETIPVRDMNVNELTECLSVAGAGALVNALRMIQDGSVQWTPQTDDGLVYAEKIGKGDLDFGPDEQAERICAKVRASSESHPSRMQLSGRRLSVLKAEPVIAGTLPQDVSIEQGHAAFIAKKLIIGTADGIVELKEVKPDGKKAMEGRAFAAGIQGIKNMTVQWERA